MVIAAVRCHSDSLNRNFDPDHGSSHAFLPHKNSISRLSPFLVDQAEEIQPGWGEQIWQQGMHLHNYLKSMEEHKEKVKQDEKEAAEEKKRAAKKEKKAEEKAKISEADAEKLAEQAAAELLKEAEAEEPTGLKKRKSSKKKKAAE